MEQRKKARKKLDYSERVPNFIKFLEQSGDVLLEENGEVQGFGVHLDIDEGAVGRKISVRVNEKLIGSLEFYASEGEIRYEGRVPGVKMPKGLGRGRGGRTIPYYPGTNAIRLFFNQKYTSVKSQPFPNRGDGWSTIPFP